ncbi:hypothetical protein [Mycoplasma miroungirhinis]|uniref:Uncharacterized protein n=1 Tax=Mycoplasma miroungirhinis TaxID=754516 RepID=A0A6M4JE37_9MOLU|nr:hypothetical protein [Mycoplasma miroungirhinis]QJR44357.1 hypothetical protein HLA92_02865 [Mycoplasma miroungirhinis]
MKKITKFSLFALASFGLLAVVPSVTISCAKEDNDLKTSVEKIKSELNKTKTEWDALKSALESNKKSLKENNDLLVKTNAEVTANKTEIKKDTEKLTQIETELNKIKEDFSQSLTKNYPIFSEASEKITIDYKDKKTVRFSELEGNKINTKDNISFSNIPDGVEYKFISASKNQEQTKIVVKFKLISKGLESTELIKEISNEGFKEEYFKGLEIKGITVSQKGYLDITYSNKDTDKLSQLGVPTYTPGPQSNNLPKILYLSLQDTQTNSIYKVNVRLYYNNDAYTAISPDSFKGKTLKLIDARIVTANHNVPIKVKANITLNLSTWQ